MGYGLWKKVKSYFAYYGQNKMSLLENKLQISRIGAGQSKYSTVQGFMLLNSVIQLLILLNVCPVNLCLHSETWLLLAQCLLRTFEYSELLVEN
jgi:hypothetical protein